MSDFRVKHYSVERNATVYKIDPYYNVAVPISREGKHVYIQKGKVIKSLGETKRLMLQSKERMDFLVLVNGDAVKMDDVKFIKEDDKCCQGGEQERTEDKYSESDKDKDKDKSVAEKRPDKSAYLNKSRFDKGMVTGAIIGAILLGAVVWFATGGNKLKTMIGIVAGAVLGGIIGRFAGRRGEKTISTTEESMEKEVNTDVSSATSGKERGAAKSAEKELFLQIGETYLFDLAKPSYVLTYDNGFYIAKDKDGKNPILSGTIKAKIIEANEPAMFVLNQATGKIEKRIINKPLPFLEVGKDLYVPMAFVSPSSVITGDEMKAYASGQAKLDEEIYVKGRYAGKRSYYLTYIPKVTGNT